MLTDSSTNHGARSGREVLRVTGVASTTAVLKWERKKMAETQAAGHRTWVDNRVPCVADDSKRFGDPPQEVVMFETWDADKNRSMYGFPQVATKAFMRESYSVVPDRVSSRAGPTFRRR